MCRPEATARRPEATARRLNRSVASFLPLISWCSCHESLPNHNAERVLMNVIDMIMFQFWVKGVRLISILIKTGVSDMNIREF